MMIAGYLLLHGTVDVDLLHSGADPHIGPRKTWSRKLQVFKLISRLISSRSPALRLAGVLVGTVENRTTSRSWRAGGCH